MVPPGGIEEMVGGSGEGPPQDSKRRALVGNRRKESSKDKALEKAPGLRPALQSWASRERRQGSAMNACGALDPAPARGSRSVT